MAKTGKVAVLYAEHGDYVIQDMEVPTPKAGEALIRVTLSGICGTDVHNWRGGPAAAWVQYPVVYGHEIVGTIEALGEGFELKVTIRQVMPWARVDALGV